MHQDIPRGLLLSGCPTRISSHHACYVPHPHHPKIVTSKSKIVLAVLAPRILHAVPPVPVKQQTGCILCRPVAYSLHQLSLVRQESQISYAVSQAANWQSMQPSLIRPVQRSSENLSTST